MRKLQSPEDLYGQLYTDVQEAALFTDAKLFSDAIALFPAEEILRRYASAKTQTDFSLRNFINSVFEFPEMSVSGFITDPSRSPDEHIEALWPYLRRDPDDQPERSSRIPLPYSYVVPGGRFNEIYYWDSYFTMLGLEVTGHSDLIENMVRNFDFMIRQFGFIPNGNRTYFLSRSQPPFFSLMLQLMEDQKGTIVIENYYESLKKEYAFWMNGSSELKPERESGHCVCLADGSVLNRYYDKCTTPRGEMYRDDLELASRSNQESSGLFAHVRAACESGWDFSSRWLANPSDLGSIQTLDILPVDLNCLMYSMEKMLGRWAKHMGRKSESGKFDTLAEKRKAAIESYFWDAKTGFYYDYNFRLKKGTGIVSAAAFSALFVNLSSLDQAKSVCQLAERDLLKKGGLLTTQMNSGQQWDAPNGWAPLQWLAVRGLLNYGLKISASKITSRWLALNNEVYHQTGKFLEKYNVIDTDLEGGGGEYPVQDGFGWTNGVYLKLRSLNLKASHE